MLRWLALLVVVSLSFWVSQAGAEEPARLALLIGNQTYSSKVGPLKNPHNDVSLIDASLRKLGFKVTLVKDAGYREMDTAIKEHIVNVRRAGRGAISFFYYSGHGVANPDTQVNYLIPVDVQDANDPRLWVQSFEQNDVIEKMNRLAPLATHYVIFDACRNELRLSGEGLKALGAEKGFVPVAQTAGLLIAYATAPKQTASDLGDGGGPYARALAAEIVKPDIEAVTMFRNVQLKVKQSIGQDPWLSFPSLPEVYLGGRAQQQATPAPAPGPPPSPLVQPVNEAASMWPLIKDTSSESVLEAFLQKYSDTLFQAMAKARIEELRRQKQAANSPPPQQPPPAASISPQVIERVRATAVGLHITAPKPEPPASEVTEKPAAESKSTETKTQKSAKKSTTKSAEKPAAGQTTPAHPMADLPEDHPLNEFFKNLPKETKPAAVHVTQGSGFLLSADGYVATANHVVADAQKIEAVIADGRRFEAEVIGTDARADIALLKLKGSHSNLPAAILTDDKPVLGESVFVISNQYGLFGTVTRGSVSSLDRDLGVGPYDFLQLDMETQKGASGAPVFDASGRVKGIAAATYRPSEQASTNISFAIPASVAIKVLEQLKGSGAVSRGWLGVKIQNVDDDTAASLGLEKATGTLVTEPTHGGPADGHLKAGDVVLTLAGKPIESSRDLARKIAELAPGTNVELVVLRAGKRETVVIKLGTFPASTEQAKATTPAPASVKSAPSGPAAIASLGVTVKSDPSGLTITEVVSGSDAATKGLAANDIILEIGGLPVATAADCEKNIASAIANKRKAVLVRLKSGDTTRFVAVQLKAP